MTASPPTAVGIDAALLAAPAAQQPASTQSIALSSQVVDQLVVTTINTPHREGRCEPSAQQSRIPSAALAPSVAQAPPVLSNARPPMQHRAPMTSYMTMDLREEINRRRCGEDSRTTIEHHRERQ
jgi:hypothetical protein